MNLPVDIVHFLERHHSDGVTPETCANCSSSCCSEGGFAILENVLEIYSLYKSGRLRRRGYRFPRRLSFEDFAFAHFDVWRRPVGPEDDRSALLFFHMKSLDEKGRPITLPGYEHVSYWRLRSDLFRLNPWFNHGCVFLSRPVPRWPADDGKRRACILHTPQFATHVGPKPIDCIFYTCQEPFSAKTPSQEVSDEWFHLLGRHFPDSLSRWEALLEREG